MRSELLDRSVFITLGLLAFVPLAWIRAKRRCHAGFQLLMAVVALGLAMAHTLPLYRLHYALLPQLRVPTRFMLFWYVGMAVLGGLGLDALLRRAGNRRALPGVWQAWAPAATAGLLLALALATSSWTGGTAGVLGTPGWLVAIQLGALLTLGALVARRQAGLAGAVALLLVTTEGLVYAAPFVRVEAGSARDPAVEQLATHDMVRVTSLCEQRLRVHDLVSAGIPTPDGFGSISLARYARFLRLVRDNEIEGYANVNRLGQNIERLPARLDLLDYLAVTHVVTCEPIDHERFRLVEPLGSMFLYRNLTVRPRALLTCAGEPREAEEVMRMLWRGAYDREGRSDRAPAQDSRALGAGDQRRRSTGGRAQLRTRCREHRGGSYVGIRSARYVSGQCPSPAEPAAGRGHVRHRPRFRSCSATRPRPGARTGGHG